ncbi:MAG: hypothetical protein JXD19_10290 [Deltaproteobacteria bacterium]|nr:hypothetical protein [Deltaproteobacteria bacterium]
MKTIVLRLPEGGDPVAQNDAKKHSLVDEYTYRFFRDEVFLKELKTYIRETAPEEWNAIENISGPESIDTDGHKVLSKFFFAFNRSRKRFYLHKDEFYSYGILKMEEREVVIHLLKYTYNDIALVLNSMSRSRPEKDAG